MKIRPLIAEDLGNIHLLWKVLAETQSAVEGRLAVRPEGGSQYAQYLASRLPEPHFHATCAEVEGRIVGFCISTIQTRPPSFVYPTVGYIDDLVVDPDFTRQKIGAALLNEARDWLCSQGQDRIEVQMLIGNSAAVAFWEAAGFKPYLVRSYEMLQKEQRE